MSNVNTDFHSYIPDEFSPIRWRDNALELLDQRHLPNQTTWLSYQNAKDVASAITDMVVRGAPAIGITAAYGVTLSALQHSSSNLTISDLKARIKDDIACLASSRPTAINLHWALRRMEDILNADPVQDIHTTPQALITQLAKEAICIHQQDIDFCHKIGRHGASLLSPQSTVYTHCNAGALATGGHGTALGVIRTAHTQQKIKLVFAGETRPWFQGARLTAWELTEAGIDTRLITEGAAGYTMNQHNIDWVIVGADRIAADGSVANKIGTYNLAILARHHGCKVMVAAPSSTFDLSVSTGQDIPIEQRSAQEVTHFKEQAIAADKVEAFNPSFDITPPTLIDAIVTERGVITGLSPDVIRQHLGQ